MHKRLVRGCSLDVAKNSDLYLEQFISSSDRLLKRECFINPYCWVPWDLFLKQISFHVAEVDEKGGLNSATTAGTDPRCCLTLLPLESDRKQELMQSVLFEPSPFVRGHWLPKHHQCDGNKREPLRSASVKGWWALWNPAKGCYQLLALPRQQGGVACGNEALFNQVL